MKKSILLILFLWTIHDFSAISDLDSNRMVKNVVYLQAFGIGGFGSLNYERIIYRQKDFNLGARIGISTYHIYDFTNTFNPDLIFPIALNGHYGKTHKIEFGIGQTIVSIVHIVNSDLKPRRDANIHANFTLGYRYQKKEGGLFFRCAYTPMIQEYSRYRHWGGISIGYAF